MGALKSYNETRANLREMKDKMHFFFLLCFALPCAHELPSLCSSKGCLSLFNYFIDMSPTHMSPIFVEKTSF